MDEAAPLHVAVTVEQLWQPVPGGSGTYVTELTSALSGAVRMTGLKALHLRRDVPAPAIHVRTVPLPRRLLYQAWQRTGVPRAEWSVPRCDLVHATTWAIPPTRRPLVVTVHDLAFRHDPGHFTPHGVRFFERALARTLAGAAGVIVPSETSRADCLAAGFEPGRVHVVPHGGRPNAATDEDVRAFRRRAGIDRPYLLWVGTREPRKNLAGVIGAYRHATDRLDADLVVVGPRGWGADEAAPTPGVRVVGRLDDRDLAAAYAGARAFCFPSFREGFGLPVLEAMNAGLPVVTSSGTACAEVAGAAAILVDPADTDAIAEAMIAASGSRHDELAVASRARAATFTWGRTARLTAAVYRDVSR